MRGIVRYGPDPVVAILDSARAGETYEGIPIVGAVDDALRYGPTVAIVGVATQGGRFPPAWRELLKSCIARPRRRERPARVRLGGSGAESSSRGARRPAARPAPAAGGARASRPARTSRWTRRSSSRSARTARSGRRPSPWSSTSRRARRGLASVFVPTGQTGIAIAGWGIAVDAVVADFLAARPSGWSSKGASAAAELLFVEGQGSLVHPMYSGVTLGLVHGPRRTRSSSATARARPRSRAPPGTRSRRCRARRAARADLAAPQARSGRLPRPQHRRDRGRGRRALRSRRPRRRPGFRRTIPCGSGAEGCLTPSWSGSRVRAWWRARGDHRDG